MQRSVIVARTLRSSGSAPEPIRLTLADDQVLDGLGSKMWKGEMVLYSRHSPTRKRLYVNAPVAVQTINAFSSVINVRKLIEAKKRRPFTIPR